MPFGSASTTQYSLCPSGHGRYMKYSVMPENISTFVVGRTRSECGLPMAVILTYNGEGPGLGYGHYRWRFGFAPALVDNANNTRLTPLSHCPRSRKINKKNLNIEI